MIDNEQVLPLCFRRGGESLNEVKEEGEYMRSGRSVILCVTVLNSPSLGISRRYQQLLITPVYNRCTTTTVNICIVNLPLVNLIYQVSDKGLLERCGTENGYLNEVRAVRSDLRVCASGEPESEPKGPGPGCSVNR